MKSISLIALAMTSLIAAPAFAADDPAFLNDAIKGDNTEVAMGKLAQQRGASPQTRAYGAMLIHDHGAHRTRIAMLDHSMGIQPSSAVSDDGMQAETMLRSAHGAQFDAMFKQHMIEDHTQDIAKYEAAAQSAQSPKVRELAQATLPTLHKHLDRAEAL